MWASIGTLLTMLLPLAVKLIMYFIDRKQNNDELKKQFLELLQQMDHDLPIKMRERHKAQIERIKQKLSEGK